MFRRWGYCGLSASMRGEPGDDSPVVIVEVMVHDRSGGTIRTVSPPVREGTVAPHEFFFAWRNFPGIVGDHSVSRPTHSFVLTHLDRHHQRPCPSDNAGRVHRRAAYFYQRSQEISDKPPQERSPPMFAHGVKRREEIVSIFRSRCQTEGRRTQKTRAKTLPPLPSAKTNAARFMVRRRDFRLSLLQPSSPNSGKAGAPSSRVLPAPATTGGGQENPFPSLPANNGGRGGIDAGAGAGAGGFGNGDAGFSGRAVGGGLSTAGASAMAREISLEMSPCVPVHASCGFVIEREGVRGVGRQ